MYTVHYDLYLSSRPLRDCANVDSCRAGQDDGTALKLWAVSCHLLNIRWR